ncbi:hypothetical protein EJE24_09380 [Enterobacter huaxiensis]|uniref:Uncharacterized protein n=1 Tax=Enterobacter huaxiensis TaxID=2494702 RepID=A0A3R9NEE9_9ENTR|nr:hypothetical protein EJE24_09380 [Enterobacter huaxiensis]
MRIRHYPSSMWRTFYSHVSGCETHFRKFRILLARFTSALIFECLLRLLDINRFTQHKMQGKCYENVR